MDSSMLGCTDCFDNDHCTYCACITDTKHITIISSDMKKKHLYGSLPTRLLMSHFLATIPILQHIVNLSLTTENFPISCKFSIERYVGIGGSAL